MFKSADSCNDYPKFLDVGEISKILNVSPATVRKMIRNKQLEAFKIGNRYRIAENYLHTLVQVGMKGNKYE